jgi:hypothetical protein
MGQQRAPEHEICVIWCQQIGAWWGPDARGYVTQLKDAGRFPRDVAIRLCAGAVLAAEAGELPEMPVRLVDVVSIITGYEMMTGNRTWGQWR